jgi:hypothetical protein
MISAASPALAQGSSPAMPIEARGAQCIATPSVIASLLHEFASQDAARCVLPSLACVVRPLTVGASTTLNDEDVCPLTSNQAAPKAMSIS